MHLPLVYLRKCEASFGDRQRRVRAVWPSRTYCRAARLGVLADFDPYSSNLKPNAPPTPSLWRGPGEGNSVDDNILPANNVGPQESPTPEPDRRRWWPALQCTS